MTGVADVFRFVRTTRGLLAIVLGVSFWVVHLIDTRGPRALLVEMRSNVPGLAQLFYDVGDSFVEAHSVFVRIEPATEYVTLQFTLPDRHIRRFRFDPLNVPGTFSIRNARVIDRAHRTIRRFAASELVGANQIASRIEEGDAVTFSTGPGATDASVHIDQSDPASAPLFSLHTLSRTALQAAIALLMTVALAVASFALHGRFDTTQQRLDRVASLIGDAHVLAIDRIAVGWYLAIAVFFVASVAAGLHGSALSLQADHSLGQRALQPLLGTAKPIRADEWATHSPAILNQVYRAKRFDVETSAVGPASAALIANLPVRHVTTLFRPQFWGFFVLPPAFAFSFYWQFKAVLLLVGVFSLLLLLTHSSRIAAFGALWYVFSAHTQWTYSWASLLPEMVGLFCLVMCSLFYMSVGRRFPLLFGAALICVACAVNFALCAYIPHQIPLVWFGVFLCIWWIWAKWDSIFTTDYAVRRVAALGSAGLAIILVTLAFYLDSQSALAVAANTEYPGRRLLSGGGYQISILFSHFFAYWTDDQVFPLRELTGNICEVSGFFWLAPASAFLLWGIESGEVYKKRAYGTIAAFGVLLFVWLTIPLSPMVGSLTFMNKSGVGRSLHVLGLVNVALVCIALSLGQTQRREGWRQPVMLAGAVFATLYPVFALTNLSLDGFLTAEQLLVAALYFTIVTVALLERRVASLAALLIVPQVIVFGLVNPLDRGLQVVESAPLFQFVHSRPELLRERWLVYSDAVPDSGFLSSVGCDVLTGIRYLPELKGLSTFLPPGMEPSVLNRSGVFVARPDYRSDAARFELVAHHTLIWHVNPLDARLKQLGVRYAAFVAPPPPQVASRLRQLSPTPVSGYWLYELP